MPLLSTTDDRSEASSLEASYFFYPKKGDVVGLSTSDEDFVLNKITSTYDELEKNKAPVYRRWDNTDKILFGPINKDTFKSGRANAMLPFAKQTHQTLMSHIWSRSLQTDEILFGIRGLDDKSKEHSPIQKESLLDLMRKDRFKQKLDGAVYDLLRRGICVGHVGFRESKESERVLSGQKGTEEQRDYDENGNDIGLAYIDKEVISYRGPSVKVIDCRDFVFDTKMHDDWDACFKAYRDYFVYDDILADKNYINTEGLLDLIKEDKPSKVSIAGVSNNRSRSRNKKGQENPGIDEKGRIEIIEFHGDIKMKDGTYLRNWMVVVAGRKKIIRFEENPYKINPFVKWVYEKTDDGWGYSPLDYIVDMVNTGSTLLNTNIEAAKMSVNPPMFAPKGMMPQKRLYLEEGKIIEFNQDVGSASTPIPVPLNYQTSFPFLQLFEGQAEATTAATRQLSGNITSNDKAQTATEFQGLQVVGNLIVDRIVDLFNLDFKIPVIEKFARIARMFNPEEKTVEVKNKEGLNEFQDVKADIYYGDYEYVIQDNKSELERKQNILEKIQILEKMNTDPEISQRMKKIEMSKSILRDLGFEDSSEWFMGDEEFLLKNLREAAIQIKLGGMVEIYKAGEQQQVMEQMQSMMPMMQGMMPNEGQAQATEGLPVGSEGFGATDPGAPIPQV